MREQDKSQITVLLKQSANVIKIKSSDKIFYLIILMSAKALQTLRSPLYLFLDVLHSLLVFLNQRLSCKYCFFVT